MRSFYGNIEGAIQIKPIWKFHRITGRFKFKTQMNLLHSLIKTRSRLYLENYKDSIYPNIVRSLVNGLTINKTINLITVNSFSRKINK